MLIFSSLTSTFHKLLDLFIYLFYDSSSKSIWHFTTKQYKITAALTYVREFVPIIYRGLNLFFRLQHNLLTAFNRKSFSKKYYFNNN